MKINIAFRRLAAVLAVSLMCLSAYAAVKPTVTFTHKKHPELYNCTMKLSSLKTLGRFLPAELKREVGEDYYPVLREGLLRNGRAEFKEGSACLEYKTEGLFDVHMEFRLFYLDLRDITWDELDRFFVRYFGFQLPSDASSGVDN